MVDNDDADAAGQAMREQAQKFFRRKCEFLKGVVNLKGLPPGDRVEIAFAGRSNVGKSSLLNALLGRKALARTSNMPGRTRELNFFTIGDSMMGQGNPKQAGPETSLYLVDMPGYGYARASKTLVAGWNRLIREYLRGRPNLSRLFLLIDARHGLKPGDIEIMDMLDECAVSYQLVLTKLDKLKVKEREGAAPRLAAQIAARPAAHPHVLATSSQKNLGLKELREAIFTLLENG